jgi:hypothetical protein
VKRLGLLGLAAVVAGCNFMSFFDYEDGAPVQVIEKPSGFVPGSFGSALLAMTADDDAGHHYERLMVGARAATPIFEYVLSEDGTVLPAGDETNRLCDAGGHEGDAVCTDAAVGSAISAVDAWSDGVLCIAIGGTGDAAVVSCDRNESTQRWDGGVRSGFGISVAGIPGEERILIGSNDQTVWIGERAVPDPTPLDLGACTSDEPGFGSVVAAAPEFWAIGSQGAEIVLAEPDGEGFAKVSVAAGGAATLLVADIVGDESPDLVAGGAGTVRIWDGDDLVAADPCGDVRHADVQCADVPGRKVTCGVSFGASLAVGDINGDGDPELLVGDPAAKVDGVSRAGAAFVYGRNGADTLDGAPLAALTDSVPEDGAELGRAVAVGPILGRGEAIVGSNGEVFVFFCTGISDDRPGAGQLTDGCRQKP